jgi:hypothetical protein
MDQVITDVCAECVVWDWGERGGEQEKHTRHADEWVLIFTRQA